MMPCNHDETYILIKKEEFFCFHVTLLYYRNTSETAQNTSNQSINQSIFSGEPGV